MFEQLFVPTGEPADGFSQEEREALLDMIHYCFYSGESAPPFDRRVLPFAIPSVNWDPAVPYETYELRSAYLAIQARRDAQRRLVFLGSIRRRLNLPENLHRAGLLCQAVVTAMHQQEAAPAVVASR